MAKLLSQTELERATQEFGQEAIEQRNGQSFLKGGFALGGLSDSTPTPTTPIAGSPDALRTDRTSVSNVPTAQTGLSGTLNQFAQNLLTSNEGRSQIFDTQQRIESARESSKTQEEELKRRSEQQKARIDEIFGRRETELKEGFEQQRGTESAVQFRLGQAGSSFAIEQTQLSEAKRQAQLSDLSSEKAFLIQQAENAQTDADFKLAGDLTNQIQGIEDKERTLARESRQDEIQLFNTLLGARREERAQTEFQQEQAQTQLENIVSSGLVITDIPLEQKQSLEQALSLPSGGFDSFYEKYQSVQEAEAIGDEIKKAQSLVNLLQDLPIGQSVSIGGVEYESLAQAEDPDIYTIKTEDRNGVVQVIGVDKATGEEKWRQNLGRIGKGTVGKGIADDESPIRLTQDEKNRAIALGIGDWSIEAQNAVLNGLTPTQQTQFLNDFNAEQEKATQSLDPIEFIQEWALRQDEEEAGGYDSF